LVGESDAEWYIGPTDPTLFVEWRHYGIDLQWKKSSSPLPQTGADLYDTRSEFRIWREAAGIIAER
jgi:hypothetical protein